MSKLPTLSSIRRSSSGSYGKRQIPNGNPTGETNRQIPNGNPSGETNRQIPNGNPSGETNRQIPNGNSNGEMSRKLTNKPAPPTLHNITPMKKNTFLSDSDSDYYKNAILTYNKYNHQITAQRDWMKYKFGLRIRDILDDKRDIKVLSVGSGPGDVDMDFLDEIVKCGIERLGERGYSVLYHVVEPNQSNVECFRNKVEHKAEYNRVKFVWTVGTFDKFCNDFRPRESEENKFDFVHYARVLYHIDSWKTFDYTYKHLLAKKGIMCGIGENEDALWPKLMHFVAEHKMEHEAFQASGPVSQNYFLPGWIQLARERDWRYESYVHAYYFDITPMYDPHSQEGNYLIDFVLHTKHARKTLQPNIIEDFFKLLGADKKDRTMVKNGVKIEKKYFPCELGAIMITKE